ncbi:MAG: hypothetical protein AAFS07_16405 [Pseudomonadota bacterium]
MIARFCLVGAALTLAACAEPARVAEMTVAAGAVDAAGTAIERSVCVKSVAGGEETNPLWTSEVDDAGFRGALERSLSNNGLSPTTSADCRYDLDTNLLGLAQPSVGFDMTVTANVNYSVFTRATGEPFFQSTVQTPFTADFSSAFAGVERLKLANEGAIRTNIETFLDELVTDAKRRPAAPPTGAPAS